MLYKGQSTRIIMLLPWVSDCWRGDLVKQRFITLQFRGHTWTWMSSARSRKQNMMFSISCIQ